MEKFNYDVDGSKMLDIILDFHNQMKEALEIAKEIELPDISDSIDNIVYCGMGGSAICGDFIKNLLRDELSVPMEVVRNYSIPDYVNEKTLMIIVSYSGNTEETLSCLSQGIDGKANLLGISSGGELERIFNKILSTRAGVHKHIKIPIGFPPRTAFGFIFVPLLLSLSKLGLTLSDHLDDVNETISYLEEVAAAHHPDKIPNKAYNIAQELRGTIPVIYGVADSTVMIARRWTTQLSENGKILAYYNAIPEMNHNEIVGWENLIDVFKRISVIFLIDNEDSKRIALRQHVTKQLLENDTDGKPFPAKILEIKSEGISRLSRWFSLIYLGDFVSWYLAVNYKTDPTPVRKIDILKKSLAESV